LLRLIDPSKTGKFIPILLNELKGIPHYEYGDYTDNLDLPIVHLPSVNKVILNYLIDLIGGIEVVQSLHKFNEFLDKKMITKNDIQEYLNLGEIVDVTYKKELELQNFTSSPHTQRIQDNDYLILKPLNIVSSRKYGASTKWCTSSNNPETFYSYSNKGILLYILSKTTKDKWAVYYELKTKELSWWNDKDDKIDGLLVDLPESTKKDILTFIFSEKHPNSYYFSEETKKLSTQSTLETPLPEINIDGGHQEVTASPLPFTGIWRNGVNGPTWNPTTTEEKIDNMVRKTLEYHYTIRALNEGGEEIS